MSTRQRKQSKIRPLLVPGFCLCLLSYFAYHAVEGDYGLFALRELILREAELTKELELAVQERQAAESSVALMRSQSLDQDLVDERARQALNVAHPDDAIIYFEPLPIAVKR